MSKKDLIIDGNKRLPWFPKEPANYLKKTIVIYGTRNTGKSVLVNEIMYICRHMVPTVYIFSNSLSAINPYEGKVPKCCLFSDLSIEWLEKFLILQKKQSKKYNIANDINNLKSLFDKIKTAGDELREAEYMENYNAHIEIIKSKKLAYIEEVSQTHKIEKVHYKKLQKLYKEAIILSKNKIKNMKNNKSLTFDEWITFKNISLNPNVLIILDDCAANIKDWFKSSVIEELFYNGRHYFITIVVTTQVDKNIDTKFRMNTDICIFTTAFVANRYFESKSNNHSKDIILQSQKFVKKIFPPGNDGASERDKIYTKLIYHATNNIFYYTKADMHDSFTVGAKYWWAYDEKNLESKSNELEEEYKEYLKK